MTGPEDHESGQKPPPSEPSDVGWLPPSLREKLDATEAKGPGKSPPGWIVWLVVVVIVALGAWWFLHAQQEKARAEVARAAREQAVADSLARARADSVLAAARADSIAAFNALPKWKQRQIIAQQARAAGGQPALAEEEIGPFTIDAGGYLFEDRARSEAEAIKAGMNLAVQVRHDSATDTYRIYLGQFDDPEAARQAAARLAAKGLAPQARVVPMRW